VSELLYRQDLFKGKTLRVHRINQIEATVELEFGVSVTRMFSLDAVSADVPSEDYDRAMHCLVVLVGGKRLILQPDEADRENWSHRPVIAARVYLAERTYGKQVGHTCGLYSEVDPVLEVSPFFNWIRERGFRLADVKAAVNGNGVTNGRRS
jgi:hypothetical protein